MTTASSSSQQAAPLSRLTRLGVNLGLKNLSHAGPSRQPRRYTDANDSEWYIPYNGPYEQPKEAAMGGVRDRGSWAEPVGGGERVHDHYERDTSALGHGGASSSGHDHGYTRGPAVRGHAYDSFYEEEQERGRQLSPASKYSESLATFGAGERRSHVVASPTTSPISPRRGQLPAFHNFDATGSGIGEVPVPMQRFGQSSNSGHGHDHQEYVFTHGPSTVTAPVSAPSPRESVASFWTFGRSASKKGPPVNAFGDRPSIESRQSASTRQTAARVPIVMRDRSATVSAQRGENSNTQHTRPRAHTVAPPAPPTFPPALIVPETYNQYADDRPDTDRTSSPYQRHPYATAVSPTGHRQHSQLMQVPQQKPDPQQRRSPHLNLNFPLLSSKKSFTSLRRAANNLRTSVSTPNLRGEGQRGVQRSGGLSAGSPGTSSASSTGTKWLSAETWCDALLFPRPRFRLRSAHVISPPTSPVGGTPPYSAPAQTQSQPRTLKKSYFGGKIPVDTRKGSQAPSSAPPIILHSNPEPKPIAPPPPNPAPAPVPVDPAPTQQSLRPPRPKSFAQDDLAIPSPVLSLATVLRQNEEFEKEREMWKAKASRSFGNKRSRSLSRSRLKAKAKLAGQVEESEGELALSFDFLAARALHGNQGLKPSIHFAPTPPVSTTRSGLGTNTTSTGLNTTSTHSRNTSNAASATSRSNHGHGHSRKESWSKTAIKTAKHTANATGLCAFNDDLSPADEKLSALETRHKQDRTKHPLINLEKDPKEDEVIVISAQNTSYLSPHKQTAGGPSLSPVPSDISGESVAQTGVGIALSTPTGLEQHFQFMDHPYATGKSESVPRSADYAGPHPSHVSKTTDSAVNDSSLSEISSRHRKPGSLQPQRTFVDTSSLHPYAAMERRSRPTVRTGSIPPSSKMFADVGTGSIREVLPDDIQYSPYSAQYSESSKRNSEALGVEEALSLAFSHGEMDRGDVNEGSDQRRDESGDFGVKSGAQELIAPPGLRLAYQDRSTQVSQADEGPGEDSWQTTQDEDNTGNLIVPTPMSTFSYKNSSPAQGSYESSPMTSPRQFKKFDDMEDYSDLFYRPGQQSSSYHPRETSANSSRSSGQPTPSTELVRTLSRDGDSGTQRPMLTRSNSALTRLRRELSEEYRSNIVDRHVLGSETALRRHVSEVIEVDEEVDEAHAVLSQESSPPAATLPLRVQMNHPESSGPGNLIPEDVESSRASSILERYETEEGTEIYYRLGEVPALATPDPVTSTTMHRASTHVSYVDNNTPPILSRSLSPDDRRQDERRSRPSLLPPQSATTSTGRGSYQTSTSSTSHISQLSDFPAPPGHPPSLTPGSIIQSYFGNSPEPLVRAEFGRGARSRSHSRSRSRSRSPEPEPEPEPERPGREERRSRRTTFGTLLEDPTVEI